MKKDLDIEMTKVSTNSPGHIGFGKSNSFKAQGKEAVYMQHVDHHDDHDHHSEHDIHPLSNGAQQIYYIIDAESLKSGKATINIKDNTAVPGALGLLGFGLTTFLLNLHNAGVYPMNAMIMSMGLVYGGLAQIIAGIFEFKRGDLFGMIAFMSYGFFWWSLILIIMLPKMGNFPAPDNVAMGFYLFIWGIFSLCMFVGTLLKRAPIALSFIFFTVVILFMLLAATKWSESEKLEKAAGIEGIICGLSAIYLAFAMILNDVSGRTILPVGART